MLARLVRAIKCPFIIYSTIIQQKHAFVYRHIFKSKLNLIYEMCIFWCTTCSFDGIIKSILLREGILDLVSRILGLELYDR